MPSRPQSERNVTQSEKDQIAAAYGYTGPRGIAYLEFDHRVPFALCGSNLPDNVWPELVDDAPVSMFVHNRKDQLEARMFALIRAGRVGFAQAQQVFLGDWRHAWCVYVDTPTDGVTCDL